MGFDAWDLFFELDPALDGSWSSDESAYILPGTTIDRGRRSALQPIRPGRMTVPVSNRDGRYHPLKGIISGLDDYTPVRLYRKRRVPSTTNIVTDPAMRKTSNKTELASATVATDSTESRRDDTSIKVTTANLDGSGVEMKLSSGSRFTVKAKVDHSFSIDLKADAAGKAMKIQIAWYNSGGTNFQTDEAAVTPGTDWVRAAITAVAPPTAATAVLRVITDGAIGVFNVWLDGCQLEEEGPTPYCDGRRPGCSWTGPADNSTSTRIGTQAQNLVDNPKAEDDATGYSSGDPDWTVSRDAGEARFGSASIKIVTTGSGVPTGMKLVQRDGNRFPVTAGDKYVFSCWGLLPAAEVISWRMLFYDAASGGSNKGTSDKGSITGIVDRWIRGSSGSFVAPDGATHVEIGWFGGDPGTLYIDGCHLEQQPDGASSYCDGDEIGCAWDGTAEQSTSTRTAPGLMLFQGFIFEFLGEERPGSREAKLICYDRLALLRKIEVSIGNMWSKKSVEALSVLLDRVEKGELISNWGVEWVKLTANPLTNYSAVGGATQSALQAVVTLSDIDEILEGDWAVLYQSVAGAAGKGMRYDATSDIGATGKYRIVIWCRTKVDGESSTLTFRFLRDAVVEASSTILVTNTYQRLVLDVDFSTLGTNRYIELVSTNSIGKNFVVDDLHAVLSKHAIERDFDAGVETFALFNAFHAPAGRKIKEISDSESGLVFVKAKDITEGDAVAFRDANSRPASPIPRAVLGDGDGQPLFEAIRISQDATDRIDEVIVTSRGDLTSLGGGAVVWELSPERALALNEEWEAKYRWPLVQALITRAGGGVVDEANRNYGIGYDFLVTTAGTPTYMVLSGTAYDYAEEESLVRKRDTASGLVIPNPLRVSMPLQGTNTSAMDDEADRLLAKYKNKVLRLPVDLNQRPGAGTDEDEIAALQTDLEINDCIAVRAEERDDAPEIDKKFWVEGVQHRIGKGGALHTTLHVEEV